MKQQALYILAFKDEPLVKVGLAVDARIRSLGLGYGRFDFGGSYVVRSKDQACIRTLERNLKTFFASHQAKPQSPMRNGNTETFDSSALPGMLQSIETFRDSFPHAGFQIDRDLSSLVHPPRPRAKSPDLRQVSLSPEMQQTLNDLNEWCGEEFGRQRRLAKEIGVSEQVVSHWLNRRRTPRCSDLKTYTPGPENIRSFGTRLIENKGTFGTALIENGPTIADKGPKRSVPAHIK